MAGSGTTLVEAALLSRRAWAADIDPLAKLISKVKATLLDLSALRKALEEIGRALKNPEELDNGWRPALPQWPCVKSRHAGANALFGDRLSG
jgi:hypothetical protein